MMRFVNARQKVGMFILLLSILLVVLPLAAYGEGGDGTGNAQGVFKPLGLVSATLGDGSSIMNAKNVPLQPKITLHFDKNVVYLIYWERNKRCFHLYDENGQEQELMLSKIDDTVDFSKRQYIWAEPAEALAPGTSYRLYIAPELLAKNGGSTLAMTTNNQGVTINFRTAGEKIVPGNPPVAPEGNSVQSEQPVSSEGNTAQIEPPAFSEGGTQDVAAAPDANSVTDDVALSDDNPATGQPDSGTATKENEAADEDDEDEFAALQRGRMVQNFVAIAAVLLLAGWVAVEVLRRRKGK